MFRFAARPAVWAVWATWAVGAVVPGVMVADARADAIDYLPPETDIVLMINVREVNQSELIKSIGNDVIRDLLKLSRQATDAITATGLDPLKDFDRITLGLDIDGEGNPKPFVLLEGKFDRTAMNKSIDAFIPKNPEKLAAIKIAGRPAFRLPGLNEKETMYSAILDDTKLVVGSSEAAVASAFAALGGKRGPVVSKELLGVLAPKVTAPIAVRGWVKDKLKSINLPSTPLKEKLQGVDSLSGSISVAKDVGIGIEIGTPDPASAKQLSDIIAGVVALFRLQVTALVEEQPELQPVLELIRSTKFAPNGKLVVGAGSVKGASIEKAARTALTPKKP